MNIRKVTFLLIGLLALLGGLPSAHAAPPAQIIETVRIGMLVNPTSEAARGVELAVRTLNREQAARNADTFQRYQLVYPNFLISSAEEVPLALSFFAENEVHAIVGPVRNDFALANLEPLARAGVPVLTLATADTLTEFDVTNNIMRMVAPERFYSYSAIDYMLNDLGYTQIALIQTDIQSTEALIAAENRLAEIGRLPSAKIQVVNIAELGEGLQTVLDTGTEGVVMWGSIQDAFTVYSTLRGRGFGGAFWYRQAQEGIRSGTFNIEQSEGMLGATNWAYTTPNDLSRQFLVDYVRLFGRVPSSEAVAAYDTMFILAGQVGTVGAEMPALYESLLSVQTLFTVQGQLNPALYADGDFSRVVSLYELNEYGAGVVRARYRNGERLPDDDLAEADFNVVAAVGTPTFTPTPTLTPTATLPPSPTPSQTQLTVIGDDVTLYQGPGDFFPEIADLPSGTLATIIGGDTDLTWFVIQYRGGIAWVANDENIQVFDPGGLVVQLPIFEAPPTPQGGVTPTPAQEIADIVITDVRLTPAQPRPGEPFVADVTLRNNGAIPTGPFSVATNFEPGAVFSSNSVTNLEPNALITVPLSASVLGAGDFGIDIVADVNNDVTETFEGEGNNLYRLDYSVDYPLVQDVSNVQVTAGNTIDVAGGINDLNWTGTELVPINGAVVGILTGITYDSVRFDNINTSVVNSGQALTDAQLFPGVIIGVITGEGNRAVLRVDTRIGTDIFISFRAYTP